MLSIIIPTLNEEDYLPVLLSSIKKQSFKGYEVIVADAGSKDKTVEIAKKYGCIVVSGGLPARGRNSGADVARGNLLFFLDADTFLPPDFLKKSLGEFKSRKLNITGFCLSFRPKSKKLSFLNSFYNKMIVILEKKYPYSVIGTLVKKDLFKKLNGYDETLKLAEDNDLSRRAVEHGAKFGIIRSTEILISDRRYIKDGWFQTIAKYFLSDLHTIFIGPIKSDIFNYKFNHYKDNNS